MDEQAKLAAQGDREAMAQIAIEHYADIRRFCARRVGPQGAEDATQETFLIAWKQIKRFEGRSALRTWLLGIAHNVCRNQARQRRFELTYDLTFREEPSSGHPEAGLIDREALRKAMGKLSPEHREVVILHELEELTYEEAAQVIGIPAGTVKSRLSAAFQNLRAALQTEARP